MQQTFFIRPHNLNESVTKSPYKVHTVSERHSLYPDKPSKQQADITNVMDTTV